jgi:hypothetical protein
MMTSEQTQALTKLLVSKMSEFQIHETRGRETDLKCRCGGTLQEFRSTLVPKPPRVHRKKRITKKWRKRWERENKGRLMMSAMVGALRHPFFRCVSCGRTEAFYSAMGRNLITIEPLPEVDLPVIYTKEP